MIVWPLRCNDHRNLCPHFKERRLCGFSAASASPARIGLAFLPVKPDLWTMLIPTFGQQNLINQLMRGEPISWANVAVSVLVTIVLTIVLITVAIKFYEGERRCWPGLIYFGLK